MKVIKMQSSANSPHHIASFCGFGRETIAEATEAVLYEGARIMWVSRGKGALILNGRQYDIAKDSIISILPWDIVRFKVSAPLQVQVVRYNMDLINDVIKSIYNVDNAQTHVIEVLEKSPVIHRCTSALEEWQRIFREIELEYGLDVAAADREARPLLTIWTVNRLVGLLVLYCQLATGRVPPEGEQVEQHPEIFRYIASHLSEKITLKNLSFAFDLSETVIRSYIQETVGLTLNELLNEMRVVKSIDYLLYTNLSLEEISDLLGFVDSSHLSKVFSARMGDKVTQYRKTYTTVNNICKLRNDRTGIDIVRYIYEHYKEPLNAKLVAGQFGVTVSELNQILLYQVEKNFTLFLNTLRVKEACNLLLSTDKNVLDVAMEVGFYSIKTFNRQFLRIIGMDPRSYRKAMGG